MHSRNNSSIEAIEFGNWSELEPSHKFYFFGDHGVIPTVIFIGTLAVIGFFGNLQVLIVSFLKYKKKCTYVTYVRALAVIDFLTCVLHIPLEIVDFMYPYDFFSSLSCKLYRFNNSFLSMTSSFILLAIAVDRYRHVCHPFHVQRTVSMARKFILLCVVAGAIFSSPLFVIYGKHKIEVDFDKFAEECFISDTYFHTAYPVVYLAFLNILVVLVAIFLIYAYASIGVAIRRQERRRRTLITTYENHQNVARSSSQSIEDTDELPSIAGHFELSADLKRYRKRCSQKNKKRWSWNSRRFEVKKNTKISFLITLIFVLTYMLYVSLSFVVATRHGFRSSMSDIEITFYDLALRLIFLNNMCNPFIYGIFDDRFKSASKDLYRGMARCFLKRRCTKVSAYNY